MRMMIIMMRMMIIIKRSNERLMSTSDQLDCIKKLWSEFENVLHYLLFFKTIDCRDCDATSARIIATAMIQLPIRVCCCGVSEMYKILRSSRIFIRQNWGILVDWKNLRFHALTNWISKNILLAAASWNIVLFPLYKSL